MNFLVYIVLGLILTPIITLIHELGHAIAGLIFTNKDVKIKIGNANLNKKLKILRLIIEFNGYNSIINLNYGLTEWNKPNKAYQSIIIYLSGPLFSLLMFILSSYIILICNEYNIIYILFQIFSLLTFIQFIFTIFPIKYKNYAYYKNKSDGYKIIELLNNKK